MFATEFLYKLQDKVVFWCIYYKICKKKVRFCNDILDKHKSSTIVLG